MPEKSAYSRYIESETGSSIDETDLLDFRKQSARPKQKQSARPKKSNYNDYLKAEMGSLIDETDLSDLQKRFMKGRWLDQLLWLEGRAGKSRKQHYTLRLITIIGGVIVPALVSVNSTNAQNLRLREIFGWTAFGLSQAVAISAAIEELFHYGESYRRYRNSAENLKIQGWQFFQLSGPYQSARSHQEAYSTFAANVESVIQQDVEGYFAQAKMADEQSQAAAQAALTQTQAVATQVQEQMRRPLPPPPELQNYSKVETYQQSSQTIFHDETGNEFVSSSEVQGVSANMVTSEEPGGLPIPIYEDESPPMGINPENAFSDSATFPPNSTPVVGHEESADEFMSANQIQESPFGGMNNGAGIAPTNGVQNSAPFVPTSPPSVSNGQDDDDFVSADELRGSQMGGMSNGGAIAPPPVVHPIPAPVSPPPALQPPSPAPKTPPLTTPEVVADILKCPLKDTQKYLPGVLEALQEKGILDKPTLIAAIATIGVETGGFCPINEYGGTQYFTKMYEHRKDLGNVQPGDGARYHGRGFIQVTGRSNYRRYGEQLGLGRRLEDNPELALEPKISAQILAYYFYDRKVHQAARASDWRKVRKLVNGGYNGWNEFNNFVQRALQKL